LLFDLPEPCARGSFGCEDIDFGASIHRKDASDAVVDGRDGNGDFNGWRRILGGAAGMSSDNQSRFAALQTARFKTASMRVGGLLFRDNDAHFSNVDSLLAMNGFLANSRNASSPDLFRSSLALNGHGSAISPRMLGSRLSNKNNRLGSGSNLFGDPREPRLTNGTTIETASSNPSPATDSDGEPFSAGSDNKFPSTVWRYDGVSAGTGSGIDGPNVICFNYACFIQNTGALKDIDFENSSLVSYQMPEDLKVTANDPFPNLQGFATAVAVPEPNSALIALLALLGLLTVFGSVYRPTSALSRD
jgi:hypothetical protein